MDIAYAVLGIGVLAYCIIGIIGFTKKEGLLGLIGLIAIFAIALVVGSIIA